MRNFLIIAFLLLSLCGMPAGAAVTPWNSLTPAQKEALAPLAQYWDGLKEIQQRRLLNTAKRYPGLTTEKKIRFHKRLEAWSKLTPEQRNAAREKYKAFSKVPPETQAQIKQMVIEDNESKMQPPAGDNELPESD